MFKSFRNFSILVVLFLFAFMVNDMAQDNHFGVSNGPVPNSIERGKNPNFTGTGTTEAVIGYGYGSIALTSLSLPIPAGTPITPLAAYTFPNATFASSMTKGGDGNYYIVTVEPALYQLDPSTGAISLIGPITGMGADQPNGISYNPANSTYYMVSSNNFFSLDISSRVATLVGALNNTGGLMVDLCFDASGTCYAYDLGLDNAYTVNVSTGNATLLGALGYDANYGQGMAYDFETSTIYLSAFNNTTTTGQLRTMNPTTGATTLVTDWGFEQIAPFALNSQSGPPCPVGSASNPTPANGTFDVNINTPGNATWTNGAGTTNVQVFFGPVGNVVSVYSGTPITTLAIPAPLQYATTYQWRVVCKNDTCSAPAETWSFTTQQDPSLNVLFFDDFESGSGLWTITNNPTYTCLPTVGPRRAGYTLPGTGNVLAFDTDVCGSTTNGMDATAEVTASLDASLYSAVNLEWDNDWQAIDNADFGYIDVSTNSGATWTNVKTFDVTDVRNTHEVLNISGAVALTNFKLRLRSVQPGWDWWWVIDNFKVVASGIVPVELVSFAANVNESNVTLNWSTATETNNSGFQVERSNGSAYQVVGFVAGHGTTTEQQNYTFVDEGLATGKYTYRLKQVDFNGTFEYSNTIETEILVKEYSLGQNYPNPFNPSTKIKFNLAVDSKVSLKIFDVLGQEVATLINGQLAAGTQEVTFNASSLNSGVYFYRIDASGIDGQKYSSVKKMILTK
jgi:hypothetical protein